MSSSGFTNPSRRAMLGAFAALPALSGLFGATVAQAAPAGDRALVERRARETGDPRFRARHHRPGESKISCRRRSASPPSIRTARCGSSIRCTPRWSIAWIACRPWSRRSPNWRTSSRSRPCCPATARRSASCRCTTSKKILAATLTGMSVDEFKADVKAWLADGQGSALEAALHRTDLSADAGGADAIFRANGYKTYIVTGGGQDFVRVYSERVYGIPPEQVVGSCRRDEVRL